MAIGNIVTAAIIVVFALYLIGLFNGLVRLKNAFKNAFAQIDVQLTRRYDLIPNLVETAKKYMSHEQDTLQKVIQARNQAHQIQVDLSKGLTPDKIDQLSKVEATLSQGVGKIFALAENYPDLKGDSTMNHLMEELTSTENKIAFARQAYNDAVMDYNTGREVFPSNIVASLFAFKGAAMLEIGSEKARERVEVKF